MASSTTSTDGAAVVVEMGGHGTATARPAASSLTRTRSRSGSRTRSRSRQHSNAGPAGVPLRQADGGDGTKDKAGEGNDYDERSAVKLSLTRVLAEAKPELCIIIIATICLFGSALSNLTIPYFFGRIIDAITGGLDGDANERLNESVVGLIIVTVVGAGFTFVRGYLFNMAGERVVWRLRTKLFHAIMQQEVGFFDGNRTGELISRLGSDTSVLKSAVTSDVSMALRWSATVVGGILYLFIMSWKLTLVMVAIVPVVAIGAVIYGRYLRNLAKATRKALAQATEVAEESISAIRTVRSFAREPRQEEVYNVKILETLRLGLKAALAYGGFSGGMAGFGTLAFVAIVWYGGSLVISGEITSGTLTSFLLYSLTIGGALAGLAGLFGSMMQAVGANDRVFQLMDRKPHVPVKGGPAPRPVEGLVEFNDVHFSYPTRADQAVLRGTTFSIKPGQVAALVGPSGGGKSTVVNLIERFYDVSSGFVAIDGTDVREVDASMLRRSLGLVRQEPVLFATTIGDNISFGVDSATQEEIEEAARKANAHDFIMEFPDGYKTELGERGVRLSGGQKQRIAIARALLKDPALLLLDEATSALDAESEHLVQEALDRLMQQRTVLIIAHRLSTVKDADVVMVMDNGVIQAAGPHAELMEKSPLYARLVQHQLQPASDDSESIGSADGGAMNGGGGGAAAGAGAGQGAAVTVGGL